MLTLSKIAKEIGVSKATVSLVLNGKGKSKIKDHSNPFKFSCNGSPNVYHACTEANDVIYGRVTGFIYRPFWLS